MAASATTLPQRHNALLGALARRVVNRAAGVTTPTGTRLPDSPQQKLWLGMLESEPKLIANAVAGHTYGERLVPPAQGFTFRLSSLPETIELEVRASVYVALHPTFAEQKGFVADEADSAGRDRGSSPAPGTVAAGRTAPGLSLAAVWTKAALDPVRLSVTIPTSQRGAVRAGEAEFAAAFKAAVGATAGATLYRPRRAAAPPGSLPRPDDLLDEATWGHYVGENLLSPDEVTAPEFAASVQIEAMPGDGYYEILVAVVNTTPVPQLFDGLNPYDNPHHDPRLYEVELIASTSARIVPYDLEQVAHSYRYDRAVAAFGHACPVEVSSHGSMVRLRTTFAATEQTWRVYPRQTFTDDAGIEHDIDTTFDSLIKDPVGTLEALVGLHRQWVDREWGRVSLDGLQARHGWDRDARAEAEAAAKLAREEVEWVAAGVALLRANSAVNDAFVAANRTVKAAANGSYEAWHPFQVAWIVGCLPAMVDPGADLMVDIVWFATGGGKSEAYLGLMLATLFYGRLTGVSAGAQVWARFPLRLLALQQTERFAAMVLHAELVRRNDARMAGGDPFGVGYFVGGGNTPNKLQRADVNNPYYRGQDPNSPETAEACRVLEHCPACRDRSRRVEVRFDEPTWTMQHICRNPACPMGGVLPVWGVDDDIYRHAPAVLVGTVDKLAQLGQSPQFQVLLGRAHSRCPQHGYTGNPLWCAVYPCSQIRQPIPEGFGHVRLEIADELHLLDESLGALDGMYESLLQAVSAGLGHAPMQIVGATATIEGFGNQVKHLYQREARRFPVNGPAVGETFWSMTRVGDPLRCYVGVRPRAITMVTATREVAVTHAGWVADLLTAPAAVLAEAGLDPADRGMLDEARDAGRDLFEVLVAYCLRNEDLTSFTRDEQVSALLTSQANLAIINADADPGAIRDAVRRLERPPDSDAERVRIIAATKAIGHGFDVSRLGIMAVMGTPTQAAEIIQASARVGRVHPGLVINVINPTRDRDASVFRYYATWIRYLDRLVHKVPVNRESVPVLRRVLSGGLMTWLLQVHDRGWLTGGPRRKSLATSTSFRDAVTAGYLDRALLVDNLTRGFGIDPTSVYHQMHRDAIGAWVEDQLATLPLRAEANKRLPELLHPPVPRSLRDIEEPIVIYGDV
jgi:hypothetical protein